MSTIVSLEDFRERRNTLAYKWAVKEQKELNIPAPPVEIKFDSDRLTHNEDDCFVSIFYNKDDGKALLRRDWDKDLTVQYNLLTNYEEIKKIAPNSLEKLIQNGIKLQERYRKARVSY